MPIPPEKIEEIRNATDIIDLVSTYVKLKKSGKNFVGLCPFHTEKTPSFSVSPEKQMYYCFGCGAGGNVFSFVMNYERVSFMEALRSLAGKAGITLPSYTPEYNKQTSENEELYNACKIATQFFVNNLTQMNESKIAREYFKYRGFTPETIKLFNLGYAPNAWDALIKYSKEKGLSEDLLERAGLIRKRDDGTFYDYFRGRAIFPITSTTGRIVGFGARKLYENDPLAKYINSPETPIYNKSKILYGIYQAKETIREQNEAILVEGYIDLISVFQAGIKNIVASSGTALTEEQIQLLRRYAEKIIIVFDADSAGSNAALRGVDIILEQGLDVQVAALPPGEDPDSYVKKQGRSAFKKLIDEAVSFIDYFVKVADSEGRLKSPESQAKVLRSLIQTIAKIPDELKRNFFIKHIAERYKLSEPTLHRELEKQLANKLKFNQIHQQKPQQALRAQIIPVVQSNVTDVPKDSVLEVPVPERDLIYAMIEGGKEIVKLIEPHIPSLVIVHPVAKSVINKIVKCIEKNCQIDPPIIVDVLENEVEKRLIAWILFEKPQASKRWDETYRRDTQENPRTIALAALKMIKKRELERTMVENQQKIKQASQKGEDIIPLLQQHALLVEELKQLESNQFTQTSSSQLEQDDDLSF